MQDEISNAANRNDFKRTPTNFPFLLQLLLRFLIFLTFLCFIVRRKSYRVSVQYWYSVKFIGAQHTARYFIRNLTFQTRVY